MRKIYKYHIPLEDYPTIYLPKHSLITHVDCQGEELYLWAIVDPEQEEEAPLNIAVRGTGMDVDFDYTTWQYFNVKTPIGLVWHVFLSTKANHGFYE